MPSQTGTSTNGRRGKSGSGWNISAGPKSGANTGETAWRPAVAVRFGAMPTYEYKCPKGHLFEKTFQRITSKRFTKCPVCEKRTVSQLSGVPGLVIKGSGVKSDDNN